MERDIICRDLAQNRVYQSALSQIGWPKLQDIHSISTVYPLLVLGPIAAREPNSAANLCMPMPSPVSDMFKIVQRQLIWSFMEGSE